jgi:hypothetical protein
LVHRFQLRARLSAKFRSFLTRRCIAMLAGDFYKRYIKQLRHYVWRKHTRNNLNQSKSAIGESAKRQLCKFIRRRCLEIGVPRGKTTYTHVPELVKLFIIISSSIIINDLFQTTKIHRKKKNLQQKSYKQDKQLELSS